MTVVQFFVAGIVVQPLTARMLVGVDVLNVRRTVALAAAGEPERAAPAIIQADALPIQNALVRRHGVAAHLACAGVPSVSNLRL